MARFVFLLFGVLRIAGLWAAEYDIPAALRFTLERGEGDSPIVYYFSVPETTDESYPILLLCEGSSSERDLETVFFIRQWFADRVVPLQ